MISFYSSRYTKQQLKIVKHMFLEGLYYLRDSVAECFEYFPSNSSQCDTCKYKFICEDFGRTILHVEKLVETVESEKS